MIKRAAVQYITPGNPSAFAGKRTVYNHHRGRLRMADTDRILSSNFAYTLHRQRRKPKFRNPFFMYVRRQQLQLDLFDMQEFSKSNDGVKYLNAGIDCATKRLFVRGMPDKTAASSLSAIKSIVEEMQDRPSTVLMDAGKEFQNILVRQYMASQGIKIIRSHSEVKASIIERLGRSLQRLLYTYMTENTTRRYIDKLQDLVQSYNTRPHRTHGMTPLEADLHENRHRLITALGENYAKVVRARNQKRKTFKVGDIVRIQMEVNKFTRSYKEQFSRELFRVVGIERRMPIETYNLESVDDEETLLGSWYASELVKVTKELI